ncbi:hypothetical protein J2Z48_000710 [Croceifilum oryzae]|uniref:Uncharacterized protein n=1 Tax=Croceifilum oryzae TaxID=1553429 RepID=A0AAJ1WRP6_9BACL|nr:hypothetical protein [Croceifilum oryzae]MDQ0416543.1 hypothetical protein [Croceifilum oryzae]
MNKEDHKVDIEGTPFNSAIDHYQKIEGLPNKSVNLSNCPNGSGFFGIV